MASDKSNTNDARGPIIVSRHGRPALNRSEGPRLNWQAYRDWWNRYEAGSLAPDQTPPTGLVKIVEDAALVISSMRPRAIETARRAAPGRDIRSDALYNEAPLPPPTLSRVKYLPKTWNVLARAAWLNGHALDGESVSQARERAALAAQKLHEEAAAGKVYLAAHGWFNRMLRPELKKLGWKCTHDGGDRYWSYRVYEWRGD